MPRSRHTSLVVIASISCTIGLLGCVWLWKRHRKNYIWLVNKIFLPTVLHSVAGLVSTLINIYTAQEGECRSLFFTGSYLAFAHSRTWREDCESIKEVDGLALSNYLALLTVV
jgi:hypothetical protein